MDYGAERQLHIEDDGAEGFPSGAFLTRQSKPVLLVLAIYSS